MKRVYRLVRAPFAATPFDGEGAYRYGGRWSSPGTRVTDTAEHLSLAMVEYFVHLDPGHPPPDLVVATAEIPDHLKRVHLAPADLPDLWRLTPPIPDLAAIGDRFIRELNAAILTVPSARAPSERNWLLNPSHADFSQIATLPTEPFHFDPRFFRPRV